MSLSRRDFIRNLSVTGGGLALGFNFSLPGHAAETQNLEPNAFLRITPAGAVIVQIHKVEMGQGTVTGIVTLIAEELEVDPASVQYEMAQVNPEFNDAQYYLQITGGSNSIRLNYEPLRRTGAAAREMLLQAASKSSGLPLEQLYCELGQVKSHDGSVVLDYGNLVSTAAGLATPESPGLKSPADFRLIGKQNARLDNRPKVDGSASYGIDAPMEKTLVAVVVRPPVAAGRLNGFDASGALELPGVHSIFAIEEGVAVVASNYWRARKAAEAVNIQSRHSDSPLTDSAAITRAIDAALDEDEGFNNVRDDGAYREGDATLEADYKLPFLAHATMEPMNATVDPGTLEVWVGSQSPDLAQRFAALGLKVDADKVTVHNQFLGGGFGRRATPDHVFEAAQIARQVGARVKLVWSREDDTRHDFYRPPMHSRVNAQLNADGKVVSWRHRLAGPSLMQSNVDSMSKGLVPGWVPNFLIDFAGDMAARKDHLSVEGAKGLPYQFPHIQVAYRNVETPVRLGAWRSVGHSHNAFVVESFIDELAHAGGSDPLEFRRANLPTDSRHRRVLDRVAELSNWGFAAAGRYQGIAVHESFESVVAEVVEISLQGGKPRVEKVYCVIDCGQVVNPDIVHQQLESGVIFGLSAALSGKITLQDGAVQQGNFHDYPILRMNEIPELEVAYLESEAAPTGVGEPATPPVAAALGNALFAATGTRQRELPFSLG